jgi:hypothetical protein
MDTAAQSLVLLLSLGLRTYEHYQSGELTEEQAKAIYDAAVDRLNQAYENFRNAGPAVG